MATSDNNSLGPLVRLLGIKTAQLPTGPINGRVGVGADILAAAKDDDDDDKARGDDELSQFLGSILREAVPFIGSVSPGNESDKAAAGEHQQAKSRRIWKPKGSKSFSVTPTSTGKVKVDLFERVIKAGELKNLTTASSAGGDGGTRTARDETWVCRRSLHRNQSEEGTASWEEFRECFKEKHPETEKLFTPSVIKMEKRVVWDCERVNNKPPLIIGNETWSNFSLYLLEARHRVGKPVLKDRTFPILQMTCSAMMEVVDNTAATGTGTSTTNITTDLPERASKDEKREFLVISVTIPDFIGSSFEKEHHVNKTGPSKEGDVDQKHEPKDDDTVIASYASIERIRQLGPPSSASPAAAVMEEEQTQQRSTNNNNNNKNDDDKRDDQEEEKEKGEIEWLMALTSDAGGVLPMFIQNLAVPGQIAKDVPLFLCWIAQERKGQENV